MYDFDVNQEKDDDGNLILHTVASGGTVDQLASSSVWLSN